MRWLFLDFIEDLLPEITFLIERVGETIHKIAPVISKLADAFGVILKGALDLIMPVIESIIDVLDNVLYFIEDVFLYDWEGLWNKVVNVFKEIFGGIVSFVEDVINGVIGIINGLTSGINKITDKIPGKPIGQIPTIGEVSLPRFHTGGIIDFKGKYESPIMAMDGEMVLTAAQQKRLFDIANGAYSPESVTNSSNVNNHTDVKIEHKNYFTVRSDIDIIRISEELSRQDKKDIMSIGGD